MSVRNDLKKSIFKILDRNREGSYATQAERRNISKLFADDLVSLKFGLRDIQGLKQKHIISIVEYWKNKQLKSSTIKNRMSVLRFLCEKINKTNLIPSNNQLKIAKRIYTPTRNRAIFNSDFSKITNKYIYISLQLQRMFGLRREEALKIKPFMADKSDRLELLASWCKGGRGRVVPIETNEQRYWLDQAKALVNKFEHSLIPQEKNYKQHRSVYDKQVSRAGLRNLHGLRHAYAQRRYKELTGWEAPINGGPKRNELTKEQKKVDHNVRLILSEHLGHGRKWVLKNYLG